MQPIAKTAVHITEIIKNHLNHTPQEVIQVILKELPELSADEIIHLLTETGNAMNIDYADVNDLIATIQDAVRDVTDVSWNNTWQEIAQALYYVATVVKGFLPPKWNTVITTVLGAYEEMKGDGK